MTMMLIKRNRGISSLRNNMVSMTNFIDKDKKALYTKVFLNLQVKPKSDLYTEKNNKRYKSFSP